MLKIIFKVFEKSIRWIFDDISKIVGHKLIFSIYLRKLFIFQQENLFSQVLVGKYYRKSLLIFLKNLLEEFLTMSQK